MILDMCLCAWVCGDCSVTVYFMCQLDARPDGCVYPPPPCISYAKAPK